MYFDPCNHNDVSAAHVELQDQHSQVSDAQTPPKPGNKTNGSSSYAD